MSIPDDIATEQRSIEWQRVPNTYIVRHDNTFDNPSTWAFSGYGEAAKLRDALNSRCGVGPDGEYHVEEEPHYTTAQEVLDELALDGWFDE